MPVRDEFPDKSSLIDIAGHWFCLCHLPFSEADFAGMTKADAVLADDDKARLKSTWGESEQEAFNDDILEDKLAPVLANGALCDLTGAVFPGHFDASGKELPAVSFAHARFPGGQADFENAQFSGGGATYANATFAHDSSFTAPQHDLHPKQGDAKPKATHF